MTIAENLLLAEKGDCGEDSDLKLQERLPYYKELCAQIGNGLNSIWLPLCNLSGGKRCFKSVDGHVDCAGVVIIR